MRKNKKQKLIWTLLIVLLLAFSYLAAAWYWQFFPFNQKSIVTEQGPSQSKPTPKEKQSDDLIKQTPTSADQTEPIRETEKDLPNQYEGPNPNESESLTGVITYKAVSNEQLVLRTSINQTLSSGSCTLSLTNPSKTVTKSASIISNPSSSACDGFNIPLSELGSGTWKIEIKLISGEKTGTLKDTVNL